MVGTQIGTTGTEQRSSRPRRLLWLTRNQKRSRRQAPGCPRSDVGPFSGSRVAPKYVARTHGGKTVNGAYGETYSQVLDATDYDYETLRDAAWVSRKVGLPCRKDSLSFSHHKEVATLEPADQDEWLAIAENQGLTKCGQLRPVDSIICDLVRGERCDSLITISTASLRAKFIILGESDMLRISSLFVAVASLAIAFLAVPSALSFS